MCEQVALSCLPKEEVFAFIKSSLIYDKVADYNSFNTQRSRDYGQSLKSKSKVVFIPLLDPTPSGPSTMLTAMAEAAITFRETGQFVTVFTADQQ